MPGWLLSCQRVPGTACPRSLLWSLLPAASSTHIPSRPRSAHRVADTTDSTSMDTQGHQGLASFAFQLREASAPMAMPAYELDFVLPKRRLEQIAAFTNKVTEDRARTHIINIEGLAPCRDLPPCLPPSTLARGAPARVSAAPGATQRRAGQDRCPPADVGKAVTREHAACRAAPRTKVSAGGFVPVPQSQGTL